MIRGGYLGRILRVNLTDEGIRTEGLPEDLLRRFVGCWGLSLKLLYDELPLGVAPLEPENPLIFMTGPLTGIPEIPASNNASIATLNADTGFTAGCSHSHGFWGPNLKFAGFDGIVVEGRAERPIYLWIHDGEVEIRSAERFWGRDTHESEDLIKEDVGEPRASVATIGPAGENCCAGALIENDKHHSFSHSGVGAVMGSKRLKAIAVYGTRGVPVYDEKRLKEAAKRWHENLFKSDVARGLAKGGIPRDEYRYAKEKWITTAKNMLEVSPPEWGVEMSKHKITPKACFACPIVCSYELEVTSGPKRGYVATPAGGGENLEGAASIVGVYESGWVFYLIDLCDRLGFESSTIGCTIALAIEYYEKGLLTKEDTEGIELRWGNPELIETLMKKAARREGWLGNLLAMGPKRAAEMIGGEAPKFAIHIKGAGINLHDWRATWGIMLGQFVGGGSGWPAPAADAWATEPDAGFPEYQDPLNPRIKPEAVAKTWPKKYWDDCNGTCWFATWGVPGVLEFSAEAVAAATGWNFTREEALLVGERALHLERAFNVMRGLTPIDDMEVSPRLVEAPPKGIAEGKPIAPYVKGMVMEVYRLLGWDEKTGKPLRSTLRRVGLEDIIPDVWVDDR